jgi:hypothetical protein
MVEPGLDRHEWESQWAVLVEDFATDPGEALRGVQELITRMLSEREILDSNLVVTEGSDPELIAPWEAGRDLVQRMDSGAEIEEQDLREALESHRELFDTLLVERSAP